MEETGAYWETPYEALEAAGIEVQLLHAQHVKQLRGRKTDVGDSRWLARVCQFGLGRPSFVPPRAFRQLRAPSRHRRTLVAERSRVRNRVAKVVERAGARGRGRRYVPHKRRLVVSGCSVLRSGRRQDFVASRRLRTYAPIRLPRRTLRHMTTVLDDVTSESIDAPYIQRRVDDWIHRVRSLHAELAAALPKRWSTKAATVTMHEELMRKFKVPAASVPSLAFVHESGATASLVPRGLWLVGANGRLDLTANGQRYIVLDFADSFTCPKWHVCTAQDRRNREPFTPDWLYRILQ